MTKSLPVRAVVDTNVLFSGIISELGAPFEIVDLWIAARIRLVVTEEIVAEYRKVLDRPAFATRYAFTQARVEAIFSQLRDEELIRPDPTLDIAVHCRDPKDLKFLTAAVSAAAPYLVSGDDDILACAGDPGLGSVQIVRPREFLRLLDEDPR